MSPLKKTFISVCRTLVSHAKGSGINPSISHHDRFLQGFSRSFQANAAMVLSNISHFRLPFYILYLAYPLLIKSQPKIPTE